MNESSEAYIEECEDHQFSDYDDSGSSFGSDSSSSGRSELDDEYFKNTEKPIPVDELIRNTINPFILEQLDSNQNSPSIDNSAVAAENFTSNDFFYAEYLQRTFGYDDKPIEINNDVVDLDSFCVVRKKKRGKRKDQDSQTETNYYESNVYNWLVNNEDVDRELENGMGLEDQDIKLKNDCETNLNLKKEERRNVKTSSSTSLKEKKKNEKEKVITTTDNNKGIDETITDPGHIVRTTKNSKIHINTRANKNNENGEGSILHKKALLNPDRDTTDMSRIINKKGLLKNIQSTNEENLNSRDTKNRKQQHYYDDNNLHSWRVSDSIINILSSIVCINNSYKTKPKKSMGKRKNTFRLPISLQTKVFPILHRIPRIVCNENESIAAYYEQLFEDDMNNIVADTLTKFSESLLGLFMSHLEDDLKNYARREAAMGFGLLIQRKLSSVTLKYAVNCYGIMLTVITKYKLKYSKSRFRIICK